MSSAPVAPAPSPAPHLHGPYLDPASGRYYYCNMHTMQSEWAPEQPPSSSGGDSRALSGGGPSSAPGPHLQGPYLDPASGRYYYCNMVTMTSEWAPEQPPGGGAMPFVGQVPQYYPGYPMVPGYPGCGLPGYGQTASPADTRPACGDFKRGLCSRGAACRYAHVGDGGILGGLVAQARGFGREECADFKRGTCYRGASCKYAHPDNVPGGGGGGGGCGGGGGGYNGGRESCGDFKRGLCTRGDRCRFSHEGGGSCERRSRSRSRR
eukprot:NODE_11314_length_1295_cov_2.784247.p1 GENE.NODE_11314_length_1295_cov_2.784247~~NODE_11314_length_1295_cov_2.784247.p1  ORF type:complete len:265 (+),score=31.16 NODE_11314_length_1295_cov_2.784247:83-877(+)